MDNNSSACRLPWSRLTQMIRLLFLLTILLTLFGCPPPPPAVSPSAGTPVAAEEPVVAPQPMGGPIGPLPPLFSDPPFFP